MSALLNGKTLAARLNVPEVFVTAMKAQGFVLAYGGKTLVPDALAWLKEHPKFRYTDYIEAHRKTPKTLPKQRRPRKRLRSRAGCK